MLYGYARVSTDGQDTATQVAALRRHGVRHIVEEIRSGALERPLLERLLGRVQRGDTLVVWKVDRLARSLRGLLDVQDSLQARGVALRSVTEPIDTGTPIGKAFFHLLGVFAELERALIRERCQAGRLEAVRRGVRFGKPRSFDYAEAARLRNAGVSYPEIARRFGVHPTTVRNSLVRVGAVASRKRRRTIET